MCVPGREGHGGDEAVPLRGAPVRDDGVAPHAVRQEEAEVEAGREVDDLVVF
jgi:hypothetical protein